MNGDVTANQIAAYIHALLEPKNHKQNGVCPFSWWSDKKWSYIFCYLYAIFAPFSHKKCYNIILVTWPSIMVTWSHQIIYLWLAHIWVKPTCKSFVYIKCSFYNLTFLNLTLKSLINLNCIDKSVWYSKYWMVAHPIYNLHDSEK